MNLKKLLLFALSFVTFCSCNKSDVTNVEHSFLYASFADGTKTYLNDQAFGEVFWAEGDSISVFTDATIPDGGYKYKAQNSGEVATFESEQTVSSSVFYGNYPFNSTATFDISSKIATCVIPVDQIARENNFDPQSVLAAGTSNTVNVPFYNVCGGIRFTLKSGEITKVIFKANNGKKISGKITIDFNGNIPVATETNESTDCITLTSDTELKTGTFYYISMLPQVLNDGFSFEFYNSNGIKLPTSTCNNYVEIKAGTFATIYEADDNKRVSKISDGLNLSAEGSANCYIVTEPGTYKIAAVKGNSTTSVGSFDSAEILWQSQEGLIQSVSAKGNFLVFKTASSIASGNAIVSVKYSNNILWSWHIWFCETAPEEVTLSGSNAVMMDRNLGALAKDYTEKAYGLYYQWGRKDPFTSDLKSPFSVVKSSSTVGTLDYATSNPLEFICSDGSTYAQDWLFEPIPSLWDTNKTIYDPCPKGWRVPAGGTSGSSVWDTSAANYDAINKGAIFSLTTSGTSWYPNTGYLSKSSGEYLMGGEFCDYWANTKSQSGLSDALELNKKASSKVSNITGKIRSEGHSVRCQKDN